MKIYIKKNRKLGKLYIKQLGIQIITFFYSLFLTISNEIFNFINWLWDNEFDLNNQLLKPKSDNKYILIFK